MKYITIILILTSLIIIGCTQNRDKSMTIDNSFILGLANEADSITLMTDEEARSKSAILLNEKMCAYVAGLEDAGVDPENIQSLINPVGERLGAAFMFMPIPEDAQQVDARKADPISGQP